jgi:hypothetical protein
MASGPTKQTIYRYELGRGNNRTVSIDLPKDAVVIHADYNPNVQEFCIWAIVVIPETSTSGNEEESRRFYIAGTGNRLDKNLGDDTVLEHINTFEVPVPGLSGWFHAFEVRDAD